MSRSLQAQIQRLLDAARRLGRGDFAVEVPTEGNDEFAALGTRVQLDGAPAPGAAGGAPARARAPAGGDPARRRVVRQGPGPRRACSEIVVQTAVDGVGARCGRAAMRRRPTRRCEEVAGERRRRALPRVSTPPRPPRWTPSEVAEIQIGDGDCALARAAARPEGGDRVLGDRLRRPRRPRLHRPASASCSATSPARPRVSIENVDLHETVQRQAVTDELTGLFNHRRFQEVMAVEVERARRYDQDDGPDHARHRQLQARQRHLRAHAGRRWCCARWRACCASPRARSTSRRATAARRWRSRCRRPTWRAPTASPSACASAIEALELPLLDGDGTLRVTASFGAASLADGARDGDKDDLVAAADAALYRAKRSGQEPHGQGRVG